MVESQKTPNEKASTLPATVATVAEAIRVYYHGLGDMPEPLKEQLTKEFASEVNKAMGVKMAQSAAKKPEPEKVSW